jgi:hypothetical protein
MWCTLTIDIAWDLINYVKDCVLSNCKSQVNLDMAGVEHSGELTRIFRILRLQRLATLSQPLKETTLHNFNHMHCGAFLMDTSCDVIRCAETPQS